MLLLLVWLPGGGITRAQSVPSGVVYSVPMTVTNNQGEGTPGSFTLMVTVDFSQYSSYAAPNLQNVEFFTPSGNVIPSWLESGSGTSNAVFWLRLGSIPAKSVGTIFMGFASPSADLFGGSQVGEAAELSPVYGLYDNGPSVFPFYDNFRGSTLSSDWVNNSAESGNTVNVNNGLLIGQSSTGADSLAVYSRNAFAAPGVVEFYTTIHASTSAFHLGVGLMNSSDPFKNNIAVGSMGGPARGLWTTSDGSYYCAANPQFASDFNASHVYSISVSQAPSSTVTASVDYDSSSAMSTNRDVPTVPLSMGLLNEGGVSGSIGPTDWVRIRAYPPNGVMPAVSFSSSSSSTSSTSSQTQTGTTNQSQSAFFVSCQPPSVAVGSSTTCTAGLQSSNGTVATGTVSWGAPGPGGLSPAGFSPPQCTLSGGVCAVSYTPSSPASPVSIIASYSGDPHYPQAKARFWLNVISTATTTTTITFTSGSITLTSTSIVTSTFTGTVTSGTQTTGTSTTTMQTSGPTLPSLPSFSITPLVPLTVMAAMLVIAAALAVNWLRGMGGNPKPAEAPKATQRPGTQEGSS